MEIEELKKRLSEELKTCGKTQVWIAKELNIDQANISNYTTGKQLPALDTFAKLCNLLDLDAEYILGLKE